MALDFFALFRIVILLICLLMTVIGASQWQFGNGAGVRFYYTGVQQGSGGTRFSLDTVCKSTQSTMRAGLAFAILASIFLGFTLFSAILAAASSAISALREYGSPLRVASLALALISFVFLLICWPVTESARSQKHCGVKLSDNDFGIARGLALIIAAWVLMFLDAVFALVSIVRFTTTPDS